MTPLYAGGTPPGHAAVTTAVGEPYKPPDVGASNSTENETFPLATRLKGNLGVVDAAEYGARTEIEVIV